MEFCSHFEQIADSPNFLRKLALEFCLRQKSLKLRHSSNWAANLFKIWQNSNAAFSVAYLFFIIYLKFRVWTITRLDNLSECVCWMLSVLSQYKYQEKQPSTKYYKNRLNITKILRNNNQKYWHTTYKCYNTHILELTEL